jgi:hypothetical protein
MSETQTEPRLTQYPSPGAKLAEALSKAQYEFKPPKKNKHVDFTDKNGRRVKYSYADLADIIEAIREPFGKNGLAVFHQLAYDGNFYGLKTSLVHLSGEFIDTWYPLPDPTANAVRPQEFGSSLTYARRYSLSSLVGIASDEDDDGQLAEPSNQQNPLNNEKVKAQVKNFAPKNTEQNRQKLVDELKSKTNSVNPEDVVQQSPADEFQDQSKPETKKGPGDYVVAIGTKKYDGKKIKEIGESDLKEMRTWIEGQLKKDPPPKNISLLFDLKTSINLFFQSVGVK